ILDNEGGVVLGAKQCRFHRDEVLCPKSATTDPPSGWFEITLIRAAAIGRLIKPAQNHSGGGWHKRAIVSRQEELVVATAAEIQHKEKRHGHRRMTEISQGHFRYQMHVFGGGKRVRLGVVHPSRVPLGDPDFLAW